MRCLRFLLVRGVAIKIAGGEKRAWFLCGESKLAFKEERVTGEPETEPEISSVKTMSDY